MIFSRPVITAMAENNAFTCSHSTQPDDMEVGSNLNIDRRFELRSDQTKDNTIDICCFSTKHTTLRSKTKDWLSRNHDNMS
jgi:hypothetical protein